MKEFAATLDELQRRDFLAGVAKAVLVQVKLVFIGF